MPNSPHPPASSQAADHAISHGIATDAVTDGVVGARRWRRWMPWLTSGYFVAVYAAASLTTDPDVDGGAANIITSWILLPLVAVMTWYCFRHARHSLVHALVAVGLGAAVFVGAMALGDSNAFGGILLGLPACAGWYGATRILDRHRGMVPGWSQGPGQTLRMVGLGLVVGVVLGAVNLIGPIIDGIPLALSSPPETVRALLGALQPGVFEEVAFHFFPLAWWIAARGGLPATRWGTLGMYAWLILPHAALHVPDLVLTDPGDALVQTLYPAIVFGIPLVWLTVRRGAAAAIAAHWGIDAIRFALGW